MQVLCIRFQTTYQDMFRSYNYLCCLRCWSL